MAPRSTALRTITLLLGGLAVPLVTTAAPTAAPTEPSANSNVTNTAPSSILSPCTSVHIFLARDHNEPSYPGRQGALAGSICWSLESCDYEDIAFPNAPTADDNDYCASVTEGAANGLAQVNAYAQRCPDAKLVLSGYGWGAGVVGDVVGGGGGRFGVDEEHGCEIGLSAGLGRSSGAGSYVSAVLLFGDIRHVGGKPYNYLDGAQWSSWNPRTPQALAQFDEYADRFRSYCARSDAVCAASGPGPFVEDDQVNYFDRYADEAAGWVRWRLMQP